MSESPKFTVSDIPRRVVRFETRSATVHITCTEGTVTIQTRALMPFTFDAVDLPMYIEALQLLGEQV